MAHGTSELKWLRHSLQEIGFSTLAPIPLFCHNQTTLHIASNLISQRRAKHIEVDCHFIRDKILSEDICIPFVKSGNQLDHR